MSQQDGLAISVGLFVASALWARRRQNHQKRIRCTDRSALQLTNTSDRGNVSSRGEAALAPPIPYLNLFLEALQDLCDPSHNPRGYIPLCVAENKLVLDLIGERFMQSGTATAAFCDSAVFCYNSFLGMPLARQAIAYFVERRFLKEESSIQFQHVVIGSGAAGLLFQTFYLLGEAGDACLIPAPYYAAFENDMNLIGKVVPVGITQAEPTLGPTEMELEHAYQVALSKGCNPRFILLTNPHNPLGTLYPPQVIRRIIAWARQRNMHTIVDEIYALSTFNDNFQSVLELLDNDLGTDVHWIWALSKDFGSSGLRLGVLYTQNEIFLQALATSNMFSGVSSPIQYMVAELLTDTDFVDAFLEESRHRTRRSYQLCVGKLEEMVLPFVPAQAGLFVYVDFSALLPEKTFEYESILGQLMFDYAHIVLTNGQSQRDNRPGWFRICYTWVDYETLGIALERLSRLVAKLRRLDWKEDLNERALQSILD